MVDIKDLIDFCQAQAIANKLRPDDEAIWRNICRDYSKTFSTPYLEVLNMDPEHVFLAYYENQMDEVEAEENIDKMLDIIYGLEDPEYAKQKREEIDTFIEQIEKEEQDRVKSGKPIHPAMRNDNESVLIPKNTSKDEDETPKDLPKGGSINLSYLEKEETEGGFEE